jgi:hypothetical protein
MSALYPAAMAHCNNRQGCGRTEAVQAKSCDADAGNIGACRTGQAKPFSLDRDQPLLFKEGLDDQIHEPDLLRHFGNALSVGVVKV